LAWANGRVTNCGTRSFPNAKHLQHLLYFVVAAAIGQAGTLLEFTALYSMPAMTLGTRLWPLLCGCSFLYLFSQKGVGVFFFSNFVINEKTIFFCPINFFLSLGP
jgi:hypothetical protein